LPDQEALTQLYAKHQQTPKHMFPFLEWIYFRIKLTNVSYQPPSNAAL
jgi:hypothetical protein